MEPSTVHYLLVGFGVAALLLAIGLMVRRRLVPGLGVAFIGLVLVAGADRITEIVFKAGKDGVEIHVTFQQLLDPVQEGKIEEQPKLVELLDENEQKFLREMFPLGWAVFYTDGRRMIFESKLPSDLDLRWSDTQFLPSDPNNPDLIVLSLPEFQPAEGIEMKGGTRWGLPKDLSAPLKLFYDKAGRKEVMIWRRKSHAGDIYWVVGATRF